jgi:hypothetical protein
VDAQHYPLISSLDGANSHRRIDAAAGEFRGQESRELPCRTNVR